MQTIELLAGTSINQAADMLVAAAPARAMFNDIPIRAKYATTNPRDIVNQYLWASDIRRITWEHSPAGKTAAAQAKQYLSECQATLNERVAAMPDFGDVAAVLSWVEAMAPAADHIGVTYDHAAVVAAFTEAGWPPGVNCGPDFDGESPHNFAGWIVGQWLETRHPIGRFIQDWRAKFAAE